MDKPKTGAVEDWRLTDHSVKLIAEGMIKEVRARAAKDDPDAALLSIQVIYDAAMSVVRAAGDAMNEIAAKTFMENEPRQ